MSNVRERRFERSVTVPGGMGLVSGTKTDTVLVAAPQGSWPGSGGTVAPPLVIVHGGGFNTDWHANEPTLPNFGAVTHTLARYFTVYVSDLGAGDWFGSPDHTARIDDAVTWLESNMGTSGDVTLVGFSWGGCAALNYARAYPSDVRAVATVFPVIDLARFRTENAAEAVIDVAYPGGYSDGTYGSMHNPKVYASSLSSSIPVSIYYSDTDTTIPDDTITTFKTNRPSTKISMVGSNGHTDATVGESLPDLVQFCRALE